jgi:hypothetical protein
MFYMGGLGICTNPYAATVFEFEVRYNTGEANPTETTSSLDSTIPYNFDFIYATIKISFNSKGIKPGPRY